MNNNTKLRKKVGFMGRQLSKMMGRFFIIGGLSALIDYGLFALVYSLSNSILLGNFCARSVSSVFNFFGGKRFTFRSQGPLLPEAIKYFTLVLIFFFFSSSLVGIITHGLGVSAYISKIIAEGILVILSFTAQGLIIFGGWRKILTIWR